MQASSHINHIRIPVRSPELAINLRWLPILDATISLESLMQPQSFLRRSAAAHDPTPPTGRYYQVEGRRLLLHQSGSGDPAVVFLAGGGAVGLDYLNLQQRAAELATSVIYDRAGTGWSQRVDLPRAVC